MINLSGVPWEVEQERKKQAKEIHQGFPYFVLFFCQSFFYTLDSLVSRGFEHGACSSNSYDLLCQ